MIDLAIYVYMFEAWDKTIHIGRLWLKFDEDGTFWSGRVIIVVAVDGGCTLNLQHVAN